MIKKIGFGAICVVVVLQVFYIYYIKQQFPSAARAHGNIMVIQVLEEMQSTIKEKGDDQAIRELIIRQAIEEIRLKKLIKEKRLKIPSYAKDIIKESKGFDKNA